MAQRSFTGRFVRFARTDMFASPSNSSRCPSTTHNLKYRGISTATLVFTGTNFLNRLCFGSSLDIQLLVMHSVAPFCFFSYSIPDLKIHLLTYGRTLENTVYRAVCMPASNLLQEVILARWGVTLLVSES
jgi:hypothetical protein